VKFKITDKVSSFLHDGKRYVPGDIVDLPSRYASLDWLEPAKKPKPAAKPESKLAPSKEESTKLEPSKEKPSQPKK